MHYNTILAMIPEARMLGRVVQSELQMEEAERLAGFGNLGPDASVHCLDVTVVLKWNHCASHQTQTLALGQNATCTCVRVWLGH